MGIIPQLFGPGQQQFILSERSVEAMVEKLSLLAKNRTILAELSIENLEQIRHWSWEHHMTKWMLLFKTASLRHDTRAMHRKKRFLKSYMKTESMLKGVSPKDHLKKVAYRIHPDTLFWRNLKNRVLKPYYKIRNILP